MRRGKHSGKHSKTSGWVLFFYGISILSNSAFGSDSSCDDICANFSESGGKKSFSTGGGTWTSSDDTICAHILAVGDDPQVDSRAKGLSCKAYSSIQFHFSTDVYNVVKNWDPNHPASSDSDLCYNAKKVYDRCTYNNGQLEPACKAYNAITGNSSKGVKSKTSVYIFESVLLAMDVAMLGACSSACACMTSGVGAALCGTYASATCDSLGIIEGATELANTIYMQTEMKDYFDAHQKRKDLAWGQTGAGVLSLGAGAAGAGMYNSRVKGASKPGVGAADDAQVKALDDKIAKLDESIKTTKDPGLKNGYEDALKQAKAERAAAAESADQGAKKAAQQGKGASNGEALMVCGSAALAAAMAGLRSYDIKLWAQTEKNQCDSIQHLSKCKGTSDICTPPTSEPPKDQSTNWSNSGNGELDIDPLKGSGLSTAQSATFSDCMRDPDSSVAGCSQKAGINIGQASAATAGGIDAKLLNSPEADKILRNAPDLNKVLSAALSNGAGGAFSAASAGLSDDAKSLANDLLRITGENLSSYRDMLGINAPYTPSGGAADGSTATGPGLFPTGSKSLSGAAVSLKTTAFGSSKPSPGPSIIDTDIFNSRWSGTLLELYSHFLIPVQSEISSEWQSDQNRKLNGLPSLRKAALVPKK